ncbi:TOBE-like domain-containing protein [Trichothermofontia sichuanensis]|uniref:TOBE-like domain-containing protein n=1 Tax=Trichothermofontia sichuanensis TaxID=3045816 RepID=UPI0036F21CAC
MAGIGGVSATVQRLVHIGWTIRVELLLANRHPSIAYIKREQFQSLNLQPQQTVFLHPKNVRTLKPIPVKRG